MHVTPVLLSLLVFGCTAADSTGGPDPSPPGGKGDGSTTQLEVVVRTPVARLQARIACVESFNAESESNGVRLWFHPDSYPDAAAIQETGLSTPFVSGGGNCSDGVPRVTVGQFDTAAQIHAAVVDAGGYEEVVVQFYNRDDLDAAFHANTALALDELD